MLPINELTLAIEIQSRSYKLLRWVSDAVEKGFIPPSRAHEYADVSEAAADWLDQHYLNLPEEMRPHRTNLREFANFFSTYVTSSFDIVSDPGKRLVTSCGCYCPWCSHIEQAPHLRPKKLTKADKNRAGKLMVDRIVELGFEEGVDVARSAAETIVSSNDTRRAAAYSTYGQWLIRRTQGVSDGKSILALWREIAWLPTGSPIPRFQLEFKDFVNAEELLRAKMTHIDA